MSNILWLKQPSGFFARSGRWPCYAGFLTGDRLAALEHELPNAKGYPCDVTDETQLDSATGKIRYDLGDPRVLIHNAVGGAFGNFMEIDPQVLNRNFQVNTMALLHLARRLAPAMVDGWCGFNLMPDEAAAKIKCIEDLLKANDRKRSDLELAVSPYTKAR